MFEISHKRFVLPPLQHRPQSVQCERSVQTEKRRPHTHHGTRLKPLDYLKMLQKLKRLRKSNQSN